MIKQLKILLVAAFALSLVVFPAIAQGLRGGGPKPAPGPIAGAGIGYLALAGGYYLYRRWRKQNTEE